MQLPPFIQTVRTQKKFCYGSCQKELDAKKFPTSGGRFCRLCVSDRNRQKKEQLKKEQEMYSFF